MAIHQLTDEDGEIKAVISLNGIIAITPTENGVCIKRYDGEQTYSCGGSKSSNKKATVRRWMNELASKWKED